MKISDLKSYTVVGGSSPVSIPKQEGIGQKILNAGTSVTNFLGGKAVAETFGAEIAKLGATPQEKQYITQPSVKETAGSALQLGANFIPGAGTGAGLATKVAVGLGTGYAFDVGSKMQQDKTLGQTLTPGVGTAIGGGLPIAGAIIKPATKIIGRLFKGLGSGLSGASSESLDKIVNNPKYAQEISNQIKQSGGDKVLEDNAKTIVNGISKVRQEARATYGKAVQSLKATDITPKVFRDSVSQSLNKIGSVIKNGERKLTTSEFTNPTMVKKANTLINKLSKTDLNGFSLNKLQNEIDNTAFKTTGTDAERLAFNAFIRDLSGSVKTAINQSTNKLNEINKAFSKDMQLVETIQNEFGKINFKNLPEVVKVSKKLEGLFAQKGLAPREVDSFLTRIGIKPEEFKTSEAVRQLVSKEPMPANTPGFNLGEIFRTTTGALMSPEMVNSIAIATGLAKENVLPFLNALKPSARNIVINALLQENQ